MPESQTLSFGADSIVNTVREPMLVLNADLRVRWANRSFYRTFQVTQEETVDRLVYDLGNQQWDIPRLRKLLEEVLVEDNAFDDCEVEHVFPSIGWKYMLLNARRICASDDESELILLAIEDATERRLAEEARREIESRYTSLVQNIRDHSIFMMDPEGKITTWNTEAERIIGYSESEILGQSFSILFTPEDLQAGHRTPKTQRIRRLPPHSETALGQRRRHRSCNGLGMCRRSPSIGRGGLRSSPGQTGQCHRVEGSGVPSHPRDETAIIGNRTK